jgi:ribosomal protein S18 acetylase RimI-like enzyme
MFPFELKVATTNDIPLISSLGHEIWREVYPPIIGTEQVEYMLERMYNVEALDQQITREGHLFFIAFWDNEAIGFVSCSFHHGAERNRTRIHKLYLSPAMQGKGLGGKMVNHIQALSKMKGDTALELNVNKHNPALHFYHKTGFAIESEVVLDIGQGYVMDDYIMVKLLE